ncbi:hypothetical protein AX16_000800 [Volvariella volvacea WC 439]|nr:hypothetical protein AX16_000800 [Volvariella volvacea WC 439]
MPAASAASFHFPQEIIDLVVSFLHDDTTALISANTFSWAWHTASRAHLFSTITFAGSSNLIGAEECDPSLRKYQQLSQLLDEYPDTAELVKEVKICGAHRLQCSSWPSIEDIVTQLLRKFTRVKTLQLNQFYIGQVSDNFLSTLLDVCLSPSLTDLSFRSVKANTYAEIMFFSTGPGLRNLQLSWVEADPRQAPRQLLYDAMEQLLALPHRSGVLHALMMESCYMEPIVDWLLHPATGYDLTNIVNLRHIYTRSQPNLVATVERLLRATGPSLIYLEMWAPSDKETARFILHKKAFDLKITPHVKILRVAGLRFSRSICPLPCAKSLFEDIDMMHCIEEYHVILDIEASSPDSLQWAPWRMLDEILSRQWFPKLREVTFTLHVRTKRDRYGYERALGAQFPMLKEKGILSIRTVQ